MANPLHTAADLREGPPLGMLRDFEMYLFRPDMGGFSTDSYKALAPPHLQEGCGTTYCVPTSGDDPRRSPPKTSSYTNSPPTNDCCRGRE